MTRHLSRRSVITGSLALASLSRSLAAVTAQPAGSASLQSVLSYVRSQKTTGFLVIQNRKTLAEENWPAPDDRLFQGLT